MLDGLGEEPCNLVLMNGLTERISGNPRMCVNVSWHRAGPAGGGPNRDVMREVEKSWRPHNRQSFLAER